MTERNLIVVDLETTALDMDRGRIVEVAAINTGTGEVLHFAPYIEPIDLGNARGEAMQINRYYERGVWRKMLGPDATNDQYARLWDMLEGNTFAGCNPTFDSQYLIEHAPRFDPAPWHYRLADLSAYAAGALGIPPNKLIGLADICERLGVDPGIAHSALDDAKATAECFQRLTTLKGATA